MLRKWKVVLKVTRECGGRERLLEEEWRTFLLIEQQTSGKDVKSEDPKLTLPHNIPKITITSV